MRQADESERIVLGALMQDRRIFDELAIEARHFHDPRHEHLFSMIVGEYRKGHSTDMAALGQKLHGTPIPGLDLAYLHSLYTAPAMPQEAYHHQKIVAAMSILREVSQVAVKLHQSAEDADWEEAEQVLQDARRDLDEAQATSMSSDGMMTFAEALEEAIHEWTSPEQPGTPTGWADLDDKLNGGWRPGQLTILGARPAVGKSMIAGAAAVQAHHSGVAFFSLEMKSTEVTGRMAANSLGIDLSRIDQRKMTELDWQKIARLQKNPLPGLHIHVKHRIPVVELRKRVRSVLRKRPVSLVVVDYLQLMAPADKTENRERQVSRLSEDLKVLSQEFNTHVLALAQINRGGADEPKMQDLRESGGIEANADNVILLHQDQQARPGEITLKIVKNRHGRTDDINLAWQPHFGAATDLWKGRA